MPLPRELHSTLVSPLVAAPVVVVAVPIDNTATTDATIVAFKATRRMKLIRASYHQEANATAATSYTCTLQNAGNNDAAMTAALDIAGIAADSGADFEVVSTDDAILADGDHVDVVFAETGGTVTAPGLVSLLLEFQLLE